MFDWLKHNKSQSAAVNIYCDVPMMWMCGFLIVFGLVMVTSTSLDLALDRHDDRLYFITKQIVFLMIACAISCVIYFFRIQTWLKISAYLLLAAIVALVVVLLFGTEVNASKRWLRIATLSIQPSEFVKLAMIIFIANYIDRHSSELRATWQGLAKPIGVVGVLVFLLLCQPDFGTAVLMMSITFAMLFLGGANLWRFVTILMAGTSLLAMIFILEPYRMQRFVTFLDPWSDRYDSGYQITQSLIAIGSGSWFGKGLGESMQKLFYLPEAHTDFIFAIIAEEFGFIGVLLIIICYLGIVWRCFSIARRAEQQKMDVNSYIAYGIGLWFGIQAFFNIAVTMSMLPTKGITLPLISVGGSSIMAVIIAVGMLQRIHWEACTADRVLMRRYTRQGMEAVNV